MNEWEGGSEESDAKQAVVGCAVCFTPNTLDGGGAATKQGGAKGVFLRLNCG